MTPHEQHAVDRRRSAQHAPARQRKPTAIQVRLGLGAVNEEHVETLATVLEQGGLLPPGIAHRDPEGRLVILSGNHRFPAYKAAGRSSMPMYLATGLERVPTTDPRVQDVALPDGSLVISVLRGGTGFVPKADSVIEAGDQVLAIFGRRFPLLAKFIDANDKLSLQVHPDDRYAAMHEGGKLGKTEFWYILAAEPGASIVYGFKAATSRTAVQRAIGPRL